MKTALFISILLFSAPTLAEPATPAQAIGFYSNGELMNSDKFPFSDDSILKIFLQRDRGWTTQDVLDLVVKAADAVKKNFPNGERLQIGDVAAVHGGPVGQHASHQNGLDADLKYYSMDHGEQDPYDNGFNDDFVVNGAVTQNFDRQRNWFIFRELIKSGRIGRIFVDLAIKQAYCLSAQMTDENIEILRRLRPWPLHDDHFHLRVTCPESSPQCLSQVEVEEGSGCEKIAGLKVYVPTAEEKLNGP